MIEQAANGSAIGLEVVFVGLAALAAAVAAIASCVQSTRVRSSYEATILISMQERYNSPEMFNALKLLHGLYTQDPAGFAGEWEDRYRRGDAVALEQNVARRLVSRFYVDIAKMLRAGIVRSALADELMANNGVSIFFLVCEPMNDVHDAKRTRVYSDALAKYSDRTMLRIIGQS